MADTIFALSSGAPPAAIAIIRISGPEAGPALTRLAGRLPPPRRAVTASLRNTERALLDRALVLWLPGPHTATGEDCAELHLHGGRAVIAAVEQALAALPRLRPALAGEFTRRAFTNGRIDLAEAEGLADLLSAETELQRQSALALSAGAFSRQVDSWRVAVLSLSARVEAILDFSEDDDIGALDDGFARDVEVLTGELATWLARPRAELLREGFRVVLAGPPNAGKSTLFNALVEAEAAITSPIPGTTRDVVTRPVAMAGLPFLFLDTAGLREATADPIEHTGIVRARGELDRADLVLWLGATDACPPGAWDIAAQCDRAGHLAKAGPRHRVSALTGEGMAALREDLVGTARAALPRPGEAALNRRQAQLIAQAQYALQAIGGHQDPLLIAEALRLARLAFDALLGRTTTEDMLDALFHRFCIGK